MTQEYFVAEITKRGWQRISQNYANVREAQARHHRLKATHPNACVIVDTRWGGAAHASQWQGLCASVSPKARTNTG